MTNAAPALPELQPDVPAIAIDGLHVSYGHVRAVRGLGFEVGQGEIFGLLGPNGAGKTTTLSVIEGLVRPDAGRVAILGLAPTDPEAKRALGVSLQSTAFIEFLKVRELVRYYAALYSVFLDEDAIRALLDRFELGDKAEALASQLSGGQQQRLALAVAVANDPRILVLDEPTTGLDPQARRHVWDLIRTLRAEGRTVLLTTHYMEEAQELCHRIGIVDHGQLIALDTPAGLVNGLRLDATITVTARLPDAKLRALPGVTAVAADGDTLTISSRAPHDTVLALQGLALESRQPLTDLRLREANLEDVFLALTGRAIR